MTIKNLILPLIILCFLTEASAQSPYEINTKKDIPIVAGGLMGGLASLLFDANVNELTTIEVNELIAQSNEINRFDRKATAYYSASSRKSSDVLLYSSFSYPFLFLLNKKSRSDFFPIGVMTTEVFLLNASTTAITKGFARRTRPFVYNPGVDIEGKLTKNARLSFYSGHTSVVSSLSFFSAKLYSDYYPESKWKPVVWTTAAIIPAATGYFRVRGGKHFPTDVITGYIAGGLIGYFIPVIHKKKDKSSNLGFQIYPGPSSLGLTMTW